MSEITTDVSAEGGLEEVDQDTVGSPELSPPRTRAEYEAWGIASGKLWPYDKRMRLLIGTGFFFAIFLLLFGIAIGKEGVYVKPNMSFVVTMYISGVLCGLVCAAALFFYRKRNKTSATLLNIVCIVSAIAAIGLAIVLYNVEPAYIIVAPILFLLAQGNNKFAKKMGLSPEEQAKQAKQAANKHAPVSYVPTSDEVFYDEAKKKVVLLLEDTEGWYYESSHLSSLKDRIDSYVSYYESGQYKAVTLSEEVQGAVLIICFTNPPTQSALNFLRDTEKQLKERLNIELCIQSAA